MSISQQKNCDLEGGLISSKKTTPSIQAKAAHFSCSAGKDGEEVHRPEVPS